MEDSARLYLDLMKRILINLIYEDPNVSLKHLPRFNRNLRVNGRDWPRDAHTMIGLKRLENIEHCAIDVLNKGVPGDFIETGVWRGGSTIFMRAILKAFNDVIRKVWVADSFKGLPRPNAKKYPNDSGDPHHKYKTLAVSLKTVKNNFEKYGLLDDQVQFLEGWFSETLPTAPIQSLAILRLDGDMYESTIDALTHLYPKVSVGGYIIVDDYQVIRGCKKAVDDYRQAQGIHEPMVEVDWAGVYWQRRS